MRRFSKSQAPGHSRRKSSDGRGNASAPRRRRRPGIEWLILFWIASLPFTARAQTIEAPLPLRFGWTLQSSCKMAATGAQISSPGFATSGWHRTTAPSTVLAALVADGTYPDPYIGDNFRTVAGASYPSGQNFVLLPMPDDSPFRCSWWYRLEFHLPEGFAGRFLTLHFDGINYRANIWLNGRQLAGESDIAGTFRTYDFDVSSLVARGEANVLAVEVFAQTPEDLGINWVDWNPAPPDKDMGLWRGVSLEASGPVAIRDPQVITHVIPGAPRIADLTLQAELHNAGAKKISGTLSGTIDSIAFRQPVTLRAHEARTIAFNSAKFPQLRIQDAALWWPAQMGDPTLHDLRLRFAAKGAVSDEVAVRVGFREITSGLDAKGHRLFRINGRPIFIRGAGWAPDMLLRESPDRLRAEFRYVRDLNLNTLRLEGKMESQQFYDLADEQGVLVMPGWSCCDRWQDGARWTARDLQIATASLQSQALLLRGHPSVLAWLNGSDAGPPPQVERAYLTVLKQANWPNPILFSASEEVSDVTGPTGVKMTGPYDYVPPDFWLSDDGRLGGATGFNTETSPGPAIPVSASLAKIFPAAQLQPGDPAWASHTALGAYSQLDHFDRALSAVYGPPHGLDDYERKAQAMAYDSERAMFEAYDRNKYSSTTGVIQWMLNNAWPSLYWHLYDYFLQPGGGYFGAKKALEPLHAQYSYDDGSIVVVNSTYAPVPDLKLSVSVYDANLRPEYSASAGLDAPADSSSRVLTLPAEALGASSPVHFLQLSLFGADHQVVSSNFYWLSARHDVFDWSNGTFHYTPVSQYEDLTALAKLPTASLDASLSIESGSEGRTLHIHLRNTSEALAFQLELQVHRSDGSLSLLPILRSDNYFSLLPGESRDVTAELPPAGAIDEGLELVVSGWNISEIREALSGAP